MAHRHRVESKTSPRRLLAYERQRQALELRKAGTTFPAIAVQLGYATAQGAFLAVDSALRKVLKEPAEEVRTLELERLDKMLSVCWQRAFEGELEAVDRVLKILERRARYLGLDAPTTIQGLGGTPIALTAIEVLILGERGFIPGKTVLATKALSSAKENSHATPSS